MRNASSCREGIAPRASRSSELEFDNIRYTFRVVLQMAVVLMFGGQMQVIKKSRIPGPQWMIHAYSQSAATLNLLRAFATGGYATMQRVTK